MQPAPTVVTPAERIAPAAQQTPGIRREQAFAGDDRWIGLVSTRPGEWSAWHHHGDHDTYFYVLSGAIELDPGPGSSVVVARPGDFAHVPRGLVHRERTAPGDPGRIALIRVGHGPPVVNVDPPGDPA